MSTTNGYDDTFLSVPVPLPRPLDGRTVIELPYVHFTVLLDPARRLAAATGVNIDGAALLDLNRADDWHLDPRVPASVQAGDELYSRNDLDRGHLVRRRDPVWGEPALAAAANKATFVFTDASRSRRKSPCERRQTSWREDTTVDLGSGEGRLRALAGRSPDRPRDVPG